MTKSGSNSPMSFRAKDLGKEPARPSRPSEIPVGETPSVIPEGQHCDGGILLGSQYVALFKRKNLKPTLLEGSLEEIGIPQVSEPYGMLDLWPQLKFLLSEFLTSFYDFTCHSC